MPVRRWSARSRGYCAGHLRASWPLPLGASGDLKDVLNTLARRGLGSTKWLQLHMKEDLYAISMVPFLYECRCQPCVVQGHTVRSPRHPMFVEEPYKPGMFKQGQQICPKLRPLLSTSPLGWTSLSDLSRMLLSQAWILPPVPRPDEIIRDHPFRSVSYSFHSCGSAWNEVWYDKYKISMIRNCEANAQDLFQAMFFERGVMFLFWLMIVFDCLQIACRWGSLLWHAAIRGAFRQT